MSVSVFVYCVYECLCKYVCMTCVHKLCDGLVFVCICVYYSVYMSCVYE
ncbi:hypothetical protein NFI96_028594, partial [Prochilodus magdalenae]